MEELNQQIRAKAQERDAIVAELKEMTAERSKLEAQQDATNMVEGLSPQQKDALAQTLGLPSINSTAQMGNM